METSESKYADIVSSLYAATGDIITVTPSFVLKQRYTQKIDTLYC